MDEQRRKRKRGHSIRLNSQANPYTGAPTSSRNDRDTGFDRPNRQRLSEVLPTEVEGLLAQPEYLDNTDMIALRSALRMQILQKNRAIKDIKDLQQLREMALADPVWFTETYITKTAALEKAPQETSLVNSITASDGLTSVVTMDNMMDHLQPPLPNQTLIHRTTPHLPDTDTVIPSINERLSISSGSDILYRTANPDCGGMIGDNRPAGVDGGPAHPREGQEAQEVGDNSWEIKPDPNGLESQTIAIQEDMQNSLNTSGPLATSVHSMGFTTTATESSTSTSNLRSGMQAQMAADWAARLLQNTVKSPPISAPSPSDIEESLTAVLHHDTVRISNRTVFTPLSEDQVLRHQELPKRQELYLTPYINWDRYCFLAASVEKVDGVVNHLEK